jgi:hypothetical protein
MPNWVKNIVEFETNSLRMNQIIDTIKSEEDGDTNYFDFEKIIPMPESLKITSGSATDLGIDILKYQETGDDSSLRERLKYPWVIKENIKTVKELVEYCINEGTADLDSARKALFNIENYGTKDWYEWSVKNWGTKWNSSESLFEGSNIHFQTAWSVPEPIFIELSRMFPDVEIKVKFADEDIGNNCGELLLLNGEIISFDEYDGFQACEVWGYDPAEFFPEEYRDRRIKGLLD